ncbi:MAG: hypothetical protein AAFX10_00285 [Pseudomonadota bacterium]
MSSQLARYLPAAIAISFAACASAEPREESLIPASAESQAAESYGLAPIEGFKTDTLKPETQRPVEEIVVFGIRKPRVEEPKLLEDPLRLRVLKEIRELQNLDGEFEWRTEAASLDIEPPRFRVGYDPRSDSRRPELSPQVQLPIDSISVNPATLFSVDF